MASTEFLIDGDHSVIRWSQDLTRETFDKMLVKKFLGTGPEAILRFHRDLVRGAGDQLNVPLRVQDRSAMRRGDAELTNFETALTFYNQQFNIDQGRKAHEARGMSQQRVNFDLQVEARASLSSYWAYVFDSMMLAYLAGTAGLVSENSECVSNYLGVGGSWAGNSFSAPDSDHVCDPSTTMTLAVLDAAKERAKVANPRVEPTVIDGKPYYAAVLHPFSVTALRTAVSATAVNWSTVMQEVGPRGASNPIFTGALGIYNGIVLHESEFIPVDDATPYVHNLLLGRSAGHFAVGNAWGAGTSQPAMFKWTEETRDHGNIKSIGSSCIFGIQAAIWNSVRHGCVVIQTDDAAAT